MKKMATLLLLVLLTLSVTGCGRSKNVNDPDRLEAEAKTENVNDPDRLEAEAKTEKERADSYRDRVDELLEENAKLLVQIDSLASDKVVLSQKIAELKSQNPNSTSNDQQTIINLQNQVDDLKKQLEDAYNNKSTTSQVGSDVSTYQQTIDSLNSQIADLRRQLQVATSSSSYPELQNRINVLTLDLENHKQLVDTLKQQLAEQIASNSQSSSAATSSYLAIKFWSDENTYTANVNWYSDPNCTKSAGSNITIASPVVSQDKLSNGYTVYTCMSTNGLVYYSQYPYLTKNK